MPITLALGVSLSTRSGNGGNPVPPGYVTLRGKADGGTYVVLRGKLSGGTYTNLLGKV